ncbi:glycoside hydrolase family 5 protein [Gymnopilus junonius]|uniref:Glycoside hydrolase family 5 protein n=1 Tax=Gymnopilus junonius TaxID=109634 RepID=A0A9P5NXF3_GYMJU|nr:glycoside hydrolase family 5 protein [Gymnopilus junonius]
MPSYAHDWSRKGTGGGIFTDGRHFVDGHGRVCNLRGVNLSGSSKTPADHDHEKFPGDHKTVTFVGRPFPLEEAHEHFARLRRWGLTFVRFLVTWEAVEHGGPGIYDVEYLDYLRKLLSLLPQYGMTAFVSMHQDVWSRYAGGSGAPAWTLDVVGFDLHAIEDTGGAWLHGQRGGGHVEAERGLWPCGYHKLVASTMSTCFWAGDVYVPKLFVKNVHNQEVSIQQFLQNSFLDMWDMVARAVGDLEGVIGFQMINEPHPGYVNASMHAFNYNTDLHLSHIRKFLPFIFIFSAHILTFYIHTSVRIPIVPARCRLPNSSTNVHPFLPDANKLTSYTMLNTSRVKAWRPDGPTEGRCLWEYHDVWRWDTVSDKAVVLRENYFRQHPDTGKKVDWGVDFYLPFIKNDKLIFLEPIPNEFCPPTWTKDKLPENIIFAPHWYDLNALFTKAFGNFTVNVQGLSRGMFPLNAFYWGHKGARDNFSLQIRNIVEHGYRVLGENPIVMGECGIPMDMNKGEAFETDNFEWQARMMDAMMTGLEQSLVGINLWNYNSFNDDQRGDDWNGENFSWFSRKRALPPSLLYYDQDAPSLDNGGRILPSIVRPYPAKTAGIPLRFEYDMNSGTFTYEWANPTDKADLPAPHSVSNPPLTLSRPLTSRETEIFLPSQLTHSRKIIVHGLGKGDTYRYDEKVQTLFVVAEDIAPGRKHSVTVSVDPPIKPVFLVNDLWGDFGGQITSLLAVLLALLAYWFLRS